MSYSVTVGSHAERALRKLPDPLRRRLIARIEPLRENPRPQGCLKLTARPEWRIRVGSYRILYEIDDDARTVHILDVVARSEAY